MLTHEVHTTIDMNNQKKIIERLIKLHKDLKVLRIVWFKKIADSEKTYSSLIVEIAIEAMMNQLMNVSMLNSYQECACKLFEKNCYITQCFRCHEFDHMIKICRKNQRCELKLNILRRTANDNSDLSKHIIYQINQQVIKHNCTIKTSSHSTQ